MLPVIIPQNKHIIKYLNSSSIAFVSYVSVMAFVVYSCMYGFRKPYTVGTYHGIYFMGIAYKVCLVIAQVLGYMTSKFYGIKFIASMKPANRVSYILVCIILAWLSLLLFALIPPPYSLICLFLNGLPLGMIFGLVFGFLEGRKTTEIMGAFLAVSFIFASGLAKTVGKWILQIMQVNEFWMPFMAGFFFIIPLLLSLWLLSQTPPPSQEDIAHRTIRNPMTKAERLFFLKTFGWVIMPAVFSYAIFTIVRDFCEDFANELWAETGYENNIGIFAQSSTIITLIVLLIVGSFFLIKNNFKAFLITHYLVITGIALSCLSTLLFNFGIISPIFWMLTATTGLYLSYLPFNCLYFERFIAAYKITGNVGFVMYIADAFGYLGTVFVLIIKEFIPPQYSWVNFFSFLFYTAGVLGVLLILVTLQIHRKLFPNFIKHI